jgi:hypothetical protein
MTEQDWLSLTGPEDLYGELAAVVQPRKLFQLGTAFLTRVRRLISDEAVLFAIDVTRDYAAGRITVREVLERWTAAELAVGQGIWTAASSASVTELSTYDWCSCPTCERERERDNSIVILPIVQEGIRDPGWYAARAAWFALELIAEAAPSKKRERRRATEQIEQWRLFRDLVGDPLAPARSSPVRLTSHPAIGHLLAALDGDELLDPMVLLALADAVEEAGCTEQPLLSHLREDGQHFPGCWAVERIAGRELIDLPVDDGGTYPLDRYDRWRSW